MQFRVHVVEMTVIKDQTLLVWTWSWALGFLECTEQPCHQSTATKTTLPPPVSCSKIQNQDVGTDVHLSENYKTLSLSIYINNLWGNPVDNV